MYESLNSIKFSWAECRWIVWDKDVGCGKDDIRENLINIQQFQGKNGVEQVMFVRENKNGIFLNLLFYLTLFTEKLR